MRRAFLAVALGACLAFAACGDDGPPPEQPPAEPAPEVRTQPDTKEDAKPHPVSKAPAKTEARPDGALRRFRARMETLIAACKKDDAAEAEVHVKDLLLRDPETWFRDTFGNEPVKALVAEYQVWELRIPDLPGELRRNLEAGKTEILAERFEDGDDEMATTFQAIALRKMETKVPLYSLRLVEPGEEDGWHLWSFAFVEGRVRFVGRLMALTPIAADPDLARRASLRKKVERELRLGK
ncbi:MAG: hypothetical protein QNJ90_12820 [Planctomycetota bacterium]|nr:hypothetical protein [Planctomycetota bacterium]